MAGFKEAFSKSVIHGVEITLVGLVILGLFYYIGDDPEVKNAIKQLILLVLTTGGASILPALIRKWEAVGVEDYCKVDDRK